jgi:hypothetical protein
MAQQTSASLGPMRVFGGISANVGPLAAGAEGAITVPLQNPLPRAWNNTTFIAVATVQAQPAAVNVNYAAEIDNGGSTQTTIAVRIRNVGSAADTNQVRVAVVVIDTGDMIS